MKHREINFRLRIPQPEIHFRRLTGWLPTRGNVIFTLVIAALLVLAQSVGALPLGRPQAAPAAPSTGTIAYQGRLADAAGAPLTGTYNMTFRLYTGATGGTPLWSEPWTGSNGVKVSDGLFNVMLGSLTTLPQSAIAGRSQLFLGITVDTDDEMQPRVQLGSVPFAVQALTVPDGSVTTGKIADGAVTQAKLSLVRLGIGTTDPQTQIEIKDLTSNHVALTLENADTRAGIELENEVATTLAKLFSTSESVQVVESNPNQTMLIRHGSGLIPDKLRKVLLGCGKTQTAAQQPQS